jgi:hypothetical protein
LALSVAILADLVQLPINLSFFRGRSVWCCLMAADVPLEAIDSAIDIAKAIIVNSWLGFDWTLLPRAHLKWFPAWTLCQPGPTA